MHQFNQTLNRLEFIELLKEVDSVFSFVSWTKMRVELQLMPLADICNIVVHVKMSFIDVNFDSMKPIECNFKFYPIHVQR